MKKVSREDILRMVGLRDSAGLFSKVNSLMIDMYDEGGKLAEYSTQIIQTEKNITLLAQRVTDDETDIADLTVTAQQISATVEHQQDEIDEVTGTVSGHTTQIGQLQVTAQQISASVSSLTTTVNGHTQRIGELVIKDNEITQTVSSLSDDVDAIDGTVTSHTTQIGQLQTTTQQITASVSSLTTTVNGHTQSIGQLVIKDNEISQRVSVVEGDYVKNAQISLMVTKNGDGYISNALISADKIRFETFTWQVVNPTTQQTTFYLDGNGNLTVAGTITAINSGNIQITQDVNFYVNNAKFARFASTVSSFEAMLYLRNDGGPCLSAQSFDGGVGLSVLGNAGSKAIQSVGPSEFLLREGETLSIASVSSSSGFINTYFAPYSCMRTSSFTLPSNPKLGTLLICKGNSSDLIVTTNSHPILHGDSSDVLVAANSSYNFGRNAFLLFYMGSQWGLIYSA